MATRRRPATRRRRSRRRQQTTPLTLSARFVRETTALVLVFLAILSVIALFAPNAGAIVGPWHDILSTVLGWGIAFAPPLLAGLAVMLWMKTMPAERWMAASGAVVVALGVLGMFHLWVGGGAEAVPSGQGGGAVGFAVSSLLAGALGSAGAWVTLGLLVIVGLLLYFNMTVGDLVAGYLARRDERLEIEAQEARRAAARRPRTDVALEVHPDSTRPGFLDRLRERLEGRRPTRSPPSSCAASAQPSA
jgi:S-DNA-T family DNA segregation ATPase FtsK/SpoIIIE